MTTLQVVFLGSIPNFSKYKYKLKYIYIYIVILIIYKSLRSSIGRAKYWSYLGYKFESYIKHISTNISK